MPRCAHTHIVVRRLDSESLGRDHEGSKESGHSVPQGASVDWEHFLRNPPLGTVGSLMHIPRPYSKPSGSDSFGARSGSWVFRVFPRELGTHGHFLILPGAEEER